MTYEQRVSRFIVTSVKTPSNRNSDEKVSLCLEDLRNAELEEFQREMAEEYKHDLKTEERNHRWDESDAAEAKYEHGFPEND